MLVQFGSAWTQGIRDEQQDYFALADQENSGLPGHAGVLAILADGMGGMARGREAARIAVDTTRQEYARKDGATNVSTALLEAIRKANLAVYKLAEEQSGKYPVGTTIVAAVIHGRDLFWVAVGDSRVYFCRKGNIRQLSTDQNYGRYLLERVAKGELSQGEYDAAADKSALTYFLGLPSLPEIGWGHERELSPGDCIILCSDGVYKTLVDDALASAVCGQEDPQVTAESIINDVIARGNPYQDNATVVIMRLLGDASVGEDAMASAQGGVPPPAE